MNRLKTEKKVTVVQSPCGLRGEGYDSRLEGPSGTLHVSDLVPEAALVEIISEGIQRPLRGTWRITFEFEPSEETT